jgi:hypothetical protein
MHLVDLCKATSCEVSLGGEGLLGSILLPSQDRD